MLYFLENQELYIQNRFHPLKCLHHMIKVNLPKIDFIAGKDFRCYILCCSNKWFSSSTISIPLGIIYKARKSKTDLTLLHTIPLSIIYYHLTVVWFSLQTSRMTFISVVAYLKQVCQTQINISKHSVTTTKGNKPPPSPSTTSFLRILADPKSVIMMCILSLKRMFSGFRSLHEN